MSYESTIVSTLMLTVRCLCALVAFPSLRVGLKVPVILSLSLSFSVFGVLSKNLGIQNSVNNVIDLIMVVGGEALRGLFIAIPFVISLEILPYTARIIEFIRGSQLAEQQVPGIDERLCLIESAMIKLGMVIFFCYIAPRFLMVLLSVKVGVGSDGTFYPDINSEGWLRLVRQYGECLSDGFKIMAPMMLVFLSIDFAVGLIGRIADRLYLVNEALCLKLLLGLVGFAIYLYLFNEGYLNKAVVTRRL